MMHLDALPADILLEVARYLSLTEDLSHLTQSCKTLYDNITPTLYHTLTLRTRSQCLNTLSSLSYKPHIARHIQHLTLRPHGLPQHHELEGPSTPPTYVAHQAKDVSVALMDVCFHMKNLRSFSWDADDLPDNDEMWFVLRSSCPQLQNIGASIGAGVPYEKSQLWAFKSLTSFALHLRPAFFLERVVNAWPDEQPDLSAIFTLLSRCPDLESLIITGDSTEPLPMQNLLSYRWPKLKTLILDDVLLQSPPRLAHQQPPQTQSTSTPAEEMMPASTAFLLAHTYLHTLHLSSRSGLQLPHLSLPSHMPSESSLHLMPHLHTFSGPLAHLTSLPASSHSQLHTLNIRVPLFLRDVSPLTLCSALKRLPHLRTLTASFVLHSSYDHAGVLRAIVSGAPQLEELEFTCAAKPCYVLESVGRAVRPLRRLRVLKLGMVTSLSGEDDEPLGVVKMARENRRLERVEVMRLARTVRLPLRMPLALSEEGEKEGMRCGRTPMEQMGLGAVRSAEYEVERDRFGVPRAMYVREVVGVAALRVSGPGMSVKLESRRLYESAVHGYPIARMLTQWWEPEDDSIADASWCAIEERGCAVVKHGWWRWEHGTRVRKYVRDLRPVGHPERAIMGWKELLLRDESPAGEEARMLLFCAALAVVMLVIGVSQV